MGTRAEYTSGMAVPGRLEELPEDIENIQEESIAASEGAVSIKDPRKRRKCPLCSQNIYLYYINYEEMFLMCENSSCEFPFGLEALQVVHDESELKENPVKATADFYEYPTTGGNNSPQTLDSMLSVLTGTMSSMSVMSDCDKLSQIGDSDDLSIEKLEILAARLSRQDLKRRTEEQQTKEVETNLNRIKELTKEMNKLVEESSLDCKNIKNQRWLNNLKSWEEQTGKKLLTDKENVQLEKNDSKSYENDLAISIGETVGETISVKIVILSKVKEEQSQKLDNVNINK